MNPLVLLPLLAAATVAAPGGIALANTGLLAGTHLTYAAPAVAQYQVNVPVTKTVHYDVKPVVTGYSSTILKPSIVQQTVAAPLVAAAAPVVVKSEPAIVSAPVQQVVQQDAVVVQARTAAVAPAVVAAPAPVAVAQPVAIAQPVVQVRQAQAADFEPLVTKERVLAPVRQHTQITPQVTQIQPEVTVRKVVQEVQVPQPIYQTPVVHQTVVAQPQIQQVVAQPQVFSAGVVGTQLVGQQLLPQQFVGQQFVGQVGQVGQVGLGQVRIA